MSNEPIKIIELIPIAFCGRPIIPYLMEMWQKFLFDYEIAQFHDKNHYFDCDDDYYNLNEKYYFYAWNDDEYDGIKWEIRDDKKISQILFGELKKKVFDGLRDKNSYIKYNGGLLQKSSLRLKKFIINWRQKLLDYANERLSVAFLTDCCDHISKAFGKYNVDGEVYLSKLIGYVSDVRLGGAR